MNQFCGDILQGKALLGKSLCWEFIGKKSKDIFDKMNIGLGSFRKDDLDDIESPWEISSF